MVTIGCVCVCAAGEEPGLRFNTIEFRSQTFHVVHTPIEKDNVRLMWKDDAEERYRSFGTLKSSLAREGYTLRFATNAGIFTPQFKPAGLYIEAGTELRKLNTKEGRGNFHLMPNGVFYIDGDGAEVVTTERYQDRDPSPEWAVQSGPMLVIDGDIHPAFNEGSSNVRVRSGVGVTESGEVVFALSQHFVNFFDFASLFRDELGCDNALYLDGDLSMFYAPELDKTFDGGNYAAMFAIVEPIDVASHDQAEETNE